DDWDKLSEAAQQLVIHAAYGSTGAKPVTASGHFRRIRFIVSMVLIGLRGGVPAISAYYQAIARLNNAVLNQVEQQNDAYQGALTEALAEVRFDSCDGTLVTSDNARDYFRQLSRSAT